MKLSQLTMRISALCSIALVAACSHQSANKDGYLNGASDIAPQTLEFVGTKHPFAAEAVYFVMTDRFVDGDSRNNYPQQGGQYPTFNLPLKIGRAHV